MQFKVIVNTSVAPVRNSRKNPVFLARRLQADNNAVDLLLNAVVIVIKLSSIMRLNVLLILNVVLCVSVSCVQSKSILIETVARKDALKNFNLNKSDFKEFESTDVITLENISTLTFRLFQLRRF